MIGTGRYQTSFYFYPEQTIGVVLAAFAGGFLIGIILRIVLQT